MLFHFTGKYMLEYKKTDETLACIVEMHYDVTHNLGSGIKF